MTDNEIIKALECHAHRTERNLNCCDCDYIQHQDCSQRMSCDALDLINRQKSQILKEQNKNSKLRNERNHLKAEVEKLTEQFDKLSEVANKLHKENVDQKAEIESLTNKYNLAVSEREANMIGFLEELNRYETERNHLKVEFEELQSEIDKQYEQAKADILGNMSDGGTSCHWCIEQHKAEAVKEFADNLIKDIKSHRTEMYLNGLKGTPRTNEITYETVIEYIENLVEEMVGEG